MSHHVFILGAGISGLACAWFLKKRFGSTIRVTLLESSSRVGGWIRTSQGNFLFEHGPRGCRPQGTGVATLRLVEALGLQEQVVISDSAAATRYLYIQKKLHPLPRHPLALLVSPLRQGVFSALWRDWWAPKRVGSEDESIYDFIARRLGSHIAEKWVDPFISGIYAGDIKKLSIRACLPWLVEYEQKHGGILRGIGKQYFKTSKGEMHSPFIRSMKKFPLFSFKRGMETLAQALIQQLEGEIYLNCRVTKLISGSDKIILHSSQGISEADHVISTLPTYALGELLAPFDSSIASLLTTFPYATVAAVNLGYDHSVLPSKGFGYLIPHQEKEEILGCVWDSCIFPQQNTYPTETRLTVILGGIRDEKIGQLSEQECQEITLNKLSQHLHIRKDPNEMIVNKACRAIPQYEVGYLDFLSHLRARISALIPRLTMMGSAFSGVAVNDCIAYAENVAGSLLL